MAGKVCGEKCEVYSRVVGYIRPIGQWNTGKKAEYSERVPFAEAPTEIQVDGDLLAEMAVQMLNHLGGANSETAHTEADWLRTNGHELAGEVLEMLATMRDHIAEGPSEGPAA